MVAIAIKQFGGISPRTPARYLGDGQAQVALNCPAFSGSLQALKDVGASLLALPKTGVPKTIYRFGIGQPETQYWFTWTAASGVGSRSGRWGCSTFFIASRQRPKKGTAMSNEFEAHERRDFSMVDEAANKAVKKVFAILGVDIDKPESVEEFREDHRFGRKMRKAADHGALALVGLIIIGLGSLVWSGVLAQIGGNK